MLRVPEDNRGLVFTKESILFITILNKGGLSVDYVKVLYQACLFIHRLSFNNYLMQKSFRLFLKNMFLTFLTFFLLRDFLSFFSSYLCFDFFLTIKMKKYLCRIIGDSGFLWWIWILYTVTANRNCVGCKCRVCVYVMCCSYHVGYMWHVVPIIFFPFFEF